MRVHFDLSGFDPFHTEIWSRRLAELAVPAPPDATLVASPDDADCIIETVGRQSFLEGRVFSVAPDSHYHARPESTFMWDSGDFPTGRLPGLYCSLGRRLFDPTRHRGFCYPLRYNEHVAAFPLQEASFLFGFFGNPSSPLRHRIFQTLAAADGSALLRSTPSIWAGMFGSQEEEAKRSYADGLRRCRFFLCPRGNGLSSIRLFETMEASRVPVILSDALVLPQCVDWDACSIRVAESDLAGIPALLRTREADWPTLARNARREWENNFSDRHLLRRVASEISSIRESRQRTEKGQGIRAVPRLLPDFALYHAKRAWRACQRTAHRQRTGA